VTERPDAASITQDQLDQLHADMEVYRTELRTLQDQAELIAYDRTWPYDRERPVDVVREVERAVAREQQSTRTAQLQYEAAQARWIRQRDELYSRLAGAKAEVAALRADLDNRDTVIRNLDAGLAADRAVLAIAEQHIEQGNTETLKAYAQLRATEAERDGAYRERAQLVAWLAAIHPAVLAPAPDVADDGWQILYLTASGHQLSWHIHPRDAELFTHVERVPADDPRAQWDGHSTAEKYERIAALGQPVAEP
jgi:multidrug efflux pump subunit AcrA (membrane-fusion protein)